MSKKKKKKLIVNGHYYALVDKRNIKNKTSNGISDGLTIDTHDKPIDETIHSIDAAPLQSDEKFITDQTVVTEQKDDSTINHNGDEPMVKPLDDMDDDSPDIDEPTIDIPQPSTEISMDSTPPLPEESSSAVSSIDTVHSSISKTNALQKRNARYHDKRKEDKVSFLYKPAGKTKTTVAAIILILLVICFAAVIVVGIIGYNMIKDAPTLELDNFVGNDSTVIYDANGNEVAELGAYLRENIEYEAMSDTLVDAFLSIEDSRFFEHPGFDLPRFMSAALANLRTMDFSQGGSTFTMQLIKNTYFSIDDLQGGSTAEKSIERKAQEIWLALNLERHLDKETIFELYLNRINFGGNIRGVEKASQYYFGKSANELNLSECAFLAGMINLPNLYNPYINLEEATSRRNETLDMMVHHGYISQIECDLAKSIKLEDLLAGEDNAQPNSDGQYQSYIDAVINETIELTGMDPTIEPMDIYTHMQPNVQNTMEGLMDGSIKINWPDDKFQFAAISMDNRTGAVIAIAGGRNYNAGARLLNRATDQYKNPGSSVKPFLSYALAFDQLGWATTHIVTDRPIPLDPNNPRSHIFSNFDNDYRGDVTLQQAVGQSLNLPAISTLQEVEAEVGKEYILDYLHRLGFEHFDDDNYNIQFAIGGYGFDVSLEELAGAHAAMINLGEFNKPHTIDYIVHDGQTISGASEPDQLVNPAAAYFVDELMRYCVEGPYYNYMQNLERDYPVYAKTGTTDWGTPAPSGIPNGAAKDKWMVSSTNQYTNAVWMGYDRAQDGYYENWISQRNLPGAVSEIILDSVAEISDAELLAQGVDKPEEEISTITYVNGSWPYAYKEDWMDNSWLVNGERLKKFDDVPLVSIYETLEDREVGTLTGLSGSVNPDGSVNIHWNVSGICSGGVQDLSYSNGSTTIHASGPCVLDTSSLLGGYSYWGQLLLNGQYVMDISSSSGSTTVWPTFTTSGTLSACGGFSGSDAWVCSDIGTVQLVPTSDNPDPSCTWVDEWGNVLPCY